MEEEFYFLKLEALWTMINLCMCDSDELKLVLQSNIPSDFTMEVTYDPEAIQADFINNRSEVLAKLERLLKQTLQVEEPDLKLLLCILHFFNNIIASGREYVLKVVRETSLLYAIQHILANWTEVHEEILGNLA